MKNFKIIALILIILSIFLEFFVFNNDTKLKNEHPLVSVSTFALYDITKHIAGETISLVNILPFGVDPHNFELTPKLMAEIESSSLILYSGAGLEPWISKITFKHRAIDMSKYVVLRELASDEFEFHKHHDGQCAHNRLDPHYWLDFNNMQKSAVVITKELVKLQPKYEKKYIKNRDTYISMLKRLDENYTKNLSSCRLNTIVLNHNSIGYLAKKYHFHTTSLSGLSPEANPTPNDIKRVFNKIKNDGITTIFYENFVNSKAMKVIAKDAGVTIEVLQPLANITADEAKQNSTYETMMYINLKKLSKAMMCP